MDAVRIAAKITCLVGVRAALSQIEEMFAENVAHLFDRESGAGSTLHVLLP